MVIGDLSVDRVRSDVRQMRNRYGDLLLVVGGILTAGLIPLVLMLDFYVLGAM